MEGTVQDRLAAAGSSAARRRIRHTLAASLLERRIHARDDFRPNDKTSAHRHFGNPHSMIEPQNFL